VQGLDSGPRQLLHCALVLMNWYMYVIRTKTQCNSCLDAESRSCPVGRTATCIICLTKKSIYCSVKVATVVADWRVSTFVSCSRTVTCLLQTACSSTFQGVSRNKDVVMSICNSTDSLHLFCRTTNLNKSRSRTCCSWPCC